MKVFFSLLFGSIFLIFGINPVFAGSACSPYDNAQNCSPDNEKSSLHTREDKAYMRSLRRQHTREAYNRNNTTDTSLSNTDCQRCYRGKRMTVDERMRLRQQIDEAGQAIYHH